MIPISIKYNTKINYKIYCDRLLIWLTVNFFVNQSNATTFPNIAKLCPMNENLFSFGDTILAWQDSFMVKNPPGELLYSGTFNSI